MERLLTTDEASRLLGYSPHTLQFWRSHGGGPAYIKVNGKLVRYRKSDLEGWINRFDAYRSTSQYRPARVRPNLRSRRQLTAEALRRLDDVGV